VLWHQSCPVKEIDGACIRVTRERAISSKRQKKTNKKGVAEQPTQCGPESKIKLTVVKRDERKLKEAMTAFAAAVREYDKRQGKTGGEEAVARHFYGEDEADRTSRPTRYPVPAGLNSTGAGAQGDLAKSNKRTNGSREEEDRRLANRAQAVLAVKDPAN
jgi:hypothetical protein